MTPAERIANAFAKALENDIQYQAGKLRADLTEEQREKALRIGRIEFKSAGATRKR